MLYPRTRDSVDRKREYKGEIKGNFKGIQHQLDWIKWIFPKLFGSIFRLLCHVKNQDIPLNNNNNVICCLTACVTLLQIFISNVRKKDFFFNINPEKNKEIIQFDPSPGALCDYTQE